MSNKKFKVSELLLKCSILIVSILLIDNGIYRGEVKVVLRKAINICLECIGIG